MIRLKDIAQRAGVSVMTVSRVLRDKSDVASVTKSRIKKLAQEMGYVPDSSAQGLRNRTTRLFGLVISAATNPVFSRVMMAIEDQTHQMGYDLILAHTLNQPEREETVIRRLISRRVDGLFISPVYRLETSAAIYEELLLRRVPTVLLGHRAPFCDKFVNVETDDLTASLLATRHLIELGHRKIAFFAGPLAAPMSKECMEGYQRGLREAGIERDDGLIFKAGTTIEEGEKAALQFLNEQCSATAIQTTSDLVAIGAANVLLKQGLKIPEEISIVGYGNVLLSEHFRVPLTTIRQPKLRLGAAAVDLMSRLLKAEHPVSKRLAAEIVIRESTAPPPKKQALKS